MKDTLAGWTADRIPKSTTETPGPTTPDQSVFHARIYTQVWKTPLFADFGRKSIPFSTEIADIDAQ